MNHLPFIAADAWRRTRAAKLRLADLDTRASR
jgi:hypothetical protein